MAFNGWCTAGRCARDGQIIRLHFDASKPSADTQRIGSLEHTEDFLFTTINSDAKRRHLSVKVSDGFLMAYGFWMAILWLLDEDWASDPQ